MKEMGDTYVVNIVIPTQKVIRKTLKYAKRAETCEETVCEESKSQRQIS